MRVRCQGEGEGEGARVSKVERQQVIPKQRYGTHNGGGHQNFDQTVF